MNEVQSPTVLVSSCTKRTDTYPCLSFCPAREHGRRREGAGEYSGVRIRTSDCAHSCQILPRPHPLPTSQGVAFVCLKHINPSAGIKTFFDHEWSGACAARISVGASQYTCQGLAAIRATVVLPNGTLNICWLLSPRSDSETCQKLDSRRALTSPDSSLGVGG